MRWRDLLPDPDDPSSMALFRLGALFGAFDALPPLGGEQQPEAEAVHDPAQVANAAALAALAEFAEFGEAGEFRDFTELGDATEAGTLDGVDEPGFDDSTTLGP